MRLTTKAQTRTSDGIDVYLNALPLDLEAQEERAYARQMMATSRRSAANAWKWFDRIGEVSYAVTRNARIAGYAQLGAYQLNKDGTIGARLKGGLGATIVREQMYSQFGGQRALIERFFNMMKIPGDCYVIRTRNARKLDRYDGMDFCSADELDATELDERDGRTGKVKRKVLPGRPASGAGSAEALTVEIDVQDFLGRVWRPSPRFVHMPDSPLYALDDVCELLWLLTRSLKGQLRNRLAMNGILYIAQEVNKIKSAAPKAKNAERLADNEFADQLLRAAMFAITDPDKAESSLPPIAVGPGEQFKNMGFIEPSRKLEELQITLRAELIDRLLFGLDINPEGVKGAGEANHWGAWAAGDDERRVAVQPDLETMCWALTRLVLWPQMLAAGATPGKVMNTVVWYDLSRATAKTNLAEDGRQLYDRGGTTLEELRRTSGISEAAAPTEQDQIQWFGREYGDPYLAFFKGNFADVDLDKVVKKAAPGPDGAPGKGDRPKSGPGKGEPGSPNPSDRRPNGPKRANPA